MGRTSQVNGILQYTYTADGSRCRKKKENFFFLFERCCVSLSLSFFLGLGGYYLRSCSGCNNVCGLIFGSVFLFAGVCVAVCSHVNSARNFFGYYNT